MDIPVSTTAFFPATVRCIELCDGHAWCGENDGNVRIRSIPSGREIRVVPRRHKSLCSGLVTFKDKVWGAFSDGVVRVFAPNGVCLAELSRHDAAVQCIHPACNDTKIITGSLDWTVCLWDGATVTFEKRFYGHSNSVRCLASGLGNFFFTGSDDFTIRVWRADPPLAPDVATLKGSTKSVLCLAYDPKRKELWASGEDAVIRVWDTETMHLACVLDKHSHHAPVTVLMLDHGRVWSSAKDGKLRVWDAETRGLVYTMDDSTPTSFIHTLKRVQRSVLWKFWACEHDGKVKVWTVEMSAGEDKKDSHELDEAFATMREKELRIHELERMLEMSQLNRETVEKSFDRLQMADEMLIAARVQLANSEANSKKEIAGLHRDLIDARLQLALAQNEAQVRRQTDAEQLEKLQADLEGWKKIRELEEKLTETQEHKKRSIRALEEELERVKGDLQKQSRFSAELVAAQARARQTDAEHVEKLQELEEKLKVKVRTPSRERVDDDMAAARQRIATLEDQARELQRELNTAQKMISTLEGRIQDIEGELGTAKKRLVTYKDQITDLERELEIPRYRIATLDAQIRENAATDALAQRHLDDLERELGTSRHRIATSDAAHAHAAHDLENARQHISALEDQLREFQGQKTASERILKLQQEVQDTQAHAIEDLQKRIAAAGRDNDDDYPDSDSELESVRRELETAKKSIVTLEDHLNLLRTHLNLFVYPQHIGELEKELRAATQRWTELLADNTRLAEQMQSLPKVEPWPRRVEFQLREYQLWEGRTSSELEMQGLSRNRDFCAVVMSLEVKVRSLEILVARLRQGRGGEYGGEGGGGATCALSPNNALVSVLRRKLATLSQTPNNDQAFLIAELSRTQALLTAATLECEGKSQTMLQLHRSLHLMESQTEHKNYAIALMQRGVERGLDNAFRGMLSAHVEALTRDLDWMRQESRATSEQLATSNEVIAELSAALHLSSVANDEERITRIHLEEKDDAISRLEAKLSESNVAAARSAIVASEAERTCELLRSHGKVQDGIIQEYREEGQLAGLLALEMEDKLVRTPAQFRAASEDILDALRERVVSLSDSTKRMGDELEKRVVMVDTRGGLVKAIHNLHKMLRDAQASGESSIDTIEAAAQSLIATYLTDSEKEHLSTCDGNFRSFSPVPVYYASPAKERGGSGEVLDYT